MIGLVSYLEYLRQNDQKIFAACRKHPPWRSVKLRQFTERY